MLNDELELRKVIEVEHRSYQGDDREYHDDASYHLVDNEDAVGIKLAAYLVDEPCEPEPPQQRSKEDAQVAHSHLQGHVGHHEGKLGEGGHEEEHDERIRQGDKECRYAVVPERALLVAALVHVLGGIALEAIDAEDQEQQAAEYLQVELVLGVVDEIHHKAHSQAREERIDDVAASRPNTRHETKPTPLVQSALDTQDADRSHGG